MDVKQLHVWFLQSWPLRIGSAQTSAQRARLDYVNWRLCKIWNDSLPLASLCNHIRDAHMHTGLCVWGGGYIHWWKRFCRVPLDMHSDCDLFLHYLPPEFQNVTSVFAPSFSSDAPFSDHLHHLFLRLLTNSLHFFFGISCHFLPNSEKNLKFSLPRRRVIWFLKLQ